MRCVRALRGATQCLNEESDIILQVLALYDELLKQNNLSESDIISLTFSMTRDLDIKNPASILRQSGRALDLALFVVQEAEVKDSLERVVRTLLHCYLEESATLFHIYRNGAEILRPDRVAKPIYTNISAC